MIAVDYDLGKKIVETCTCKCGAELSLPWGGSWRIESYVLKCAADPSHDRVVPIKSLTRLWKEGEPIPSFIADKIERKMRRQIVEQNNVKAMVIKQDADKLGTYLAARFPQDLVKPGAALDFARWCIAHQLEPVRDCIPYHGNPYITVEWLDRKASGDKEFKGYSYKVFGQQDKEALDFDPKDLVVECQANWDGLEKPLIGLGVVTKIEREAKTGGEVDELTAKGYRAPVIRLHPQTMLFKRGRAAALKQHYHIPAPILEELPYTTVVEAEYRIIPEPEGDEKTDEPPGEMKLGQGKVGRTALSSPKAEKVGAAAPSKQSQSRATTQTKKPESATTEAKAPDEPQIEGEGFNIDLTWLKESQESLKWTDDTMLTFIISQYKVSGTSVTGALNKLTREQAEDFTNQINSRVDKQPGLFE
ncbi:MAG TPA: hypothetical protein VMV84_03880 [Dehalococcoidales bacterium]|nr:hypothetical protein [Dehalococcoidales bacterium]